MIAQPVAVVDQALFWRVARLPAKRPDLADVGENVPRVAKAIVPARLRGYILAEDGTRSVPELTNRVAAPPAHVEALARGGVASQRQQICLDDVVNVHVVTELGTVFVDPRRTAEVQAQREDPAGARVGVEERLPWSLDDAVA